MKVTLDIWHEESKDVKSLYHVTAEGPLVFVKKLITALNEQFGQKNVR